MFPLSVMTPILVLSVFFTLSTGNHRNNSLNETQGEMINHTLVQDFYQSELKKVKKQKTPGH